MSLVPLGSSTDRPVWTVRSPDGRSFAVFRVEGRLHVVDAVCPHNKGPLDQGWLRDGTTVVCPWHWYRFDLGTGACRTVDDLRLGVYPVLEVDGALYADVGGPPQQLSWSERLRAHARGSA